MPHKSVAVRIRIRIFVKDHSSHHALVEQVERKSSSRQPVVMALENGKSLPEEVDLAEDIGMLGFDAVAASQETSSIVTRPGWSYL
jgi:hypothetical protein